MHEPSNVVELIRRKRDGGELTASEIDWLIGSYTRDAIPDYQVAAFLMAVVWRGMSEDETVALTLAMARSGSQLRLRERFGLVADKHSTGGVGDKMTLVVAPVVAACGLSVAKMAGRGLGHTGGTIDKLESIPGMRTELTADEFVSLVERHGLALAAQSSELAPADGKLYGLRDLTATVESIPLIAASIMSKKLAVGPSDLLLDVKVGRGAFMKTEADARALAALMVRIGRAAGIRTTAILTAMEQPLGWAVGNALEIAEAIAALQGEGPLDVMALCLHESALLLRSAGLVATLAEGEARAKAVIASGAALEKLTEVVAGQGGDADVIRDPSQLPHARVVRAVSAPRSGWVASWAADEMGAVAMTLGAGRARKGDAIAPEVGLRLRAKAGDCVEAGAPLAEIHARSENNAEAAERRLLAAITWGDTPVERPPLILGEVG
ncbi:MAG TPA: thymidine phosphorylase [Ktedonobacterales bacterium]|nr:thymidine phosphorylase [Ktedonobacterales bacterium]